MNKARAVGEIRAVLTALYNFTRQDETQLRALPQGKLYELYVLASLVRDLRHRGFRLSYTGSGIRFKQAPGKLYTSDPHFVVQSPCGLKLCLFVDIEFQTLGRVTRATLQDRSALHELDLVVVHDATDRSNPTYDQVWLAVECKSNAVFKKSFVREALGLRRELSYLSHDAVSQLSGLVPTRPVWVPAFPASEFWLAFTDPGGLNYQQSPRAFGIDLRHMKP